MIKKQTLRVEGWRGISHSYALVNQFQLLAIYKNKLANVQHVDMPFIMSHWGAGQNSAGFHDDDQKILEGFKEPVMATGIYRISAPLELEAHATLPTLTFAVTEFGLDNGRHPPGFADSYVAAGGKVHTPSQWSKNRLIASGVPIDAIHVIPHAADLNYFFPMTADQIAVNRENLGFSNDDVLLLNVGTHHWNKGLDVLIKAFASARQINPHLKLVLKDQRSTYLMNSESYVHQVLKDNGLSDSDLLSSIRLIDGHLNLAQLNSLYNLADAYVTPYRAEGFNLPALEAQSCATPVIATQGGATDDFLHGPHFHALAGKLIENSPLKENLLINAYIEPDEDDLIEKLKLIERKSSFPDFIPRMTWADVSVKLLALL